MFKIKSRGEMAVDVQFADHPAVNKYRHHDFRLGFQRTGEVAWILADIIHNDRLSTRSRRPANALIERYAGMRRHRPFKRPKHEHGRLRARLEQVKANPV